MNNTNMNKINNIIVHAGNAHLDEFVASAIVMAAVNRQLPVERREPTEIELADSTIACVDVGRAHSLALNNYDHHQLERGARDCAMTLVARAAGLEDFMSNAYPWFERRAVLDACGPFVAAKEAGVEWAVIESFLGPWEELMLAQWCEADDETRGAMCWRFAEDILRKRKALELVDSNAERVEIDSVEVIKFDNIDDVAAVDAVSDMLTRHRSGVAVFRDNRGPGLTLLRLKDDPRVDFSRLADDPRVTFAHAGGFIAKTATRDDPRELIAKAIVA